ncbi:MAG: acyl carrier protein [Brevundimonas sp.]|nr:MAG: acyl carrier protein [Brevundimonas sp.]
MTDEQIYERLNAVFREVFFRDDITVGPQSSAADIAGWDSHKQIEILMTCEDAFGFQFTSREIDGLHTVGDLAAVIQARGK